MSLRLACTPKQTHGRTHVGSSLEGKAVYDIGVLPTFHKQNIPEQVGEMKRKKRGINGKIEKKKKQQSASLH